LTVDHNTDNQAEVKRILEEHPGEPKRNIFRGDRLLGMLAPLRAFGDFRFKWDASVIKETIGNLLGHMAVPEEYKTPPYLTVEPDVFAQKITPKDKFLVIGSDGLWDMMTPMQVRSFRDHPFLRRRHSLGGRGQNLAKFAMDSSKKLPTEGGRGQKS
jgi:pyruvate dehydrogenase phosphatase